MTAATTGRSYSFGGGRFNGPQSLSEGRYFGFKSTGEFSVSQFLADCIAYIDQHGWCQFGFKAEDGSVCGQGSIIGTQLEKRVKMPQMILDHEANEERQREQFHELLMGTLGDPNRALSAYRVEYKTNPAIGQLEQVAAYAHGYLVDAAKKAGWKAGGCEHEAMGLGMLLDGVTGHKCVPYKDPFAVFNDDPGTTVEDVKLMMKEAIGAAELDEADPNRALGNLSLALSGDLTAAKKAAPAEQG